MSDESTKSKRPEVASLNTQSAVWTYKNRPDSTRSIERIIELVDQRDELFRHISAHREIFEVDIPEQISPAILQAVQEFHDFFVGYTNYFFALAGDIDIPVEARSRESILTEALDNTRQLWGQLSRAINQRFNPVYAEKLADADEMAEEMLGRVGKLIRSKPIIYFDKSFHISRHPFQTNPLIGISLDRFRQTGEASFAHELGHHVFWNNGEIDRHSARLEEIREKIAYIFFHKSLPNVDLSNPNSTNNAIRALFEQYEIWTGWLEEVFADIFGTLILGPSFLKSVQDIIVREWIRDTTELLIHDGEHPKPALRPYIALETLRYVAEHSGESFKAALVELTDLFEARWAERLWPAAKAQEEQSSQEISASTPHSGVGRDQSLVSLEDLRSQVAPMVRMVLSTATWIADSADDQKPQTLLEAIQYWGREGSKEEMKEVVEMGELVRSDRIDDPKRRMSPPLHIGNQVNLLLPDENRLFDRFVTFMARRLEEKKEAGNTQLKELWFYILEFNLNLEQGVRIHNEWEYHSHPVSHVHDSDGNVYT